MRVYGVWSGRPRGTAEDPAHCVAEVRDMATMRGMVTKQCGIRRGHGPDGLYCRRHAARFAVKED